MKFGRAMLAHWRLDPEVVYLNHGTVGATPARVLDAQQRIRDAIERQPARFLLRELTAIAVGKAPWPVPRLRAAAAEVAAFLGARADDLAFVDNATTGVNAVLRSWDWRAGDEILVLDVAYGAVANAARWVARRHDLTVRVVELPFPPRSPDAVVEAIAGAVGPRTRMAIVDHVTSESALLLPIAEIVARLRARGVVTLVDGAHAPGALDLDLPAIGADFYAGNLHKWAWSPRPCGILWTGPGRRDQVHPVVISWGMDQGFAAEFDLLGTRDPSPALAAPEGLALLREWDFAAVRAWNHALAWEAGTRLAARWGTDLGVPESMAGTMVTVPLPSRAGSTREDANALRDALLFEDGIEVQVHAWRDRVWARISAQVYVEMADVERLERGVEQRVGA